jgi:phosphatidylglycerophosphate synthase
MSAAPPGSAESTAPMAVRLGRAQKSNVGVPAYLRFVNRRLGGWLALLAYRLGATPTQVTAVSAAVSLVGLVVLVLAAPGWGTAVVVGLALTAGYALDSADGQLARLQGSGTPAGEWLDHVVDCVRILLLHAAVLVSLYRFRADYGDPPDAVLLVPLAFGVVNVTLYFATMLSDQIRRRADRPIPAPGSGSVARSFVLLPTDNGMLCLVFFLLGAPPAFLWAYGLLLAYNALFTARNVVVTYGRLTSPTT